MAPGLRDSNGPRREGTMLSQNSQNHKTGLRDSNGPRREGTMLSQNSQSHQIDLRDSNGPRREGALPSQNHRTHKAHIRSGLHLRRVLPGVRAHTRSAARNLPRSEGFKWPPA
jgi:hypothetical protein